MAETNPGLEPWMRGTYPEVPAVLRAVLHALELAEEDIARWCASLTDEEWNLRPQGLPSVAFHVLHIARSTGRLLTYAEGGQLSPEQLNSMRAEAAAHPTGAEVRAELNASLTQAAQRVRSFAGQDLEAARGLGRKQLPTSVGGLLVHVAEHAARHAGQAVTTAKLVMSARGEF